MIKFIIFLFCLLVVCKQPSLCKDYLQGYLSYRNCGIIGIQYLKNIIGEIEVVYLYKDSPAEKAGLKIGDCIFKVDSQKLTPDTNDQQLIIGPPESKVCLFIKRNNKVYCSWVIRKDYREFDNQELMEYFK